MKRFHRRSSRKSGNRRKIAWGSSQWTNSITAAIPSGSSLFEPAWVKFPADTLGTSAFDNQILEPEDYTLVRMIPTVCIATEPLSGPATVVCSFAAGVIAWDGNNQDDPAPGTYPWPTVNGDADWIWRWVSPFTNVLATGTLQPFGAFAQNLQGAGITYTESRAQRKLSSRTGLLLVIGIDNLFGVTNLLGLSYVFDTRLCFKLP